MTPENIAGLRLPRDITLWTPLRELDVTEEEIVAELQAVARPAPFPKREPAERKAA
ncbi:MAG: hypothetical protein ACJ76V_02160 [Thermoleophilaceae bacterium]